MKTHCFAALLGVFLAVAVHAGDGAGPALVPAPVKLTVEAGQFQLKAETAIVADAASAATGQYLAEQLRKATGYPLPVAVRTDSAAPETGVLLAIDAGLTNLGTEGYQLTVTPKAVVIQAATAAGLFYGTQTLLQLLPPEILAGHVVTGTDWTAPCVQIEDQPRFGWRGYMLDVSRHFITVPEVKTLLDAMALRKMNVFHWHLVDDHGWRIEIKKYPKLTSVGAWRKDIGFDLDPAWGTAYGPDGRYGGFYTQDEIRDVVAYATARHIMVLPEIEMPGHSLAALTAYPEYGCSAKYEIPPGLGVFDGIYCTGEEGTYEFLQDVLTEVFQLFPTKYIHVGGDEVPTNSWAACPKDQAVIRREGLKDASELEGYFMRRMEKWVEAHGHTLVGWSEVRHSGLGKESVLMDWNGGGEEAAAAGHDVVMASQKSLYLCYYPSLDRTPPLRAYRQYLPIQDVYAFEPVPAGLDAAGRAHILGVETCLWTPDVGGMIDAEKMTFPRISAVAETAWSPAAAKNWEDFSRRLPAEERRLDAAGIPYWRDTGTEIGRWKAAQVKGPGVQLEWDATPAMTGPGKYRLSLNFFKGKHGVITKSAVLLADGQEIARDTHDGFTGTSTRRNGGTGKDWNYFFDVPAVKPGAHYMVQAVVSGTATNDCSGVVFLGRELAP